MENQLQNTLSGLLSSGSYTETHLSDIDFDEVVDHGEQTESGEFCGTIGHFSFIVIFNSTCVLDGCDAGSQDRQPEIETTTATEIESVQFFDVDNEELEIDSEIFSPIFSKILNNKI